MTYMLSSGQRLVADDGREVGAWKPHFMLYVPYLESEEVGLFEEVDGALLQYCVQGLEFKPGFFRNFFAAVPNR